MGTMAHLPKTRYKWQEEVVVRVLPMSNKELFDHLLTNFAECCDDDSQLDNAMMNRICWEHSFVFAEFTHRLDDWLKL